MPFQKVVPDHYRAAGQVTALTPAGVSLLLLSTWAHVRVLSLENLVFPRNSGFTRPINTKSGLNFQHKWKRRLGEAALPCDTDTPVCPSRVKDSVSLLKKIFQGFLTNTEFWSVWIKRERKHLYLEASVTSFPPHRKEKVLLRPAGCLATRLFTHILT